MARRSSTFVTRDEKPIRFLFENSLFLIGGTFAALIWANVHPESHKQFFEEFQIKDMFVAPADALHNKLNPSTSINHLIPDTGVEAGAGGDSVGSSADHNGGPGDGQHAINVHFLVNDVLMALFFAIAAKEVWESLLPGGALSNPRTAAMPLLATLGGVVMPAGLYVIGVAMVGQWESLFRGWAVPCATDIAFSYLVARMIFGQGHPAIAFLLLLAIADDAAGLVIIALFYPRQQPELTWLSLTLAGMVIALLMRRMKIQSFWWYLLIPGTLSWFGFHWAQIHPALGLVPIIPCMPHALTDLGVFARREWQRHDTLSEFELWWKNPVELILGLFGLCNAGVAFSAFGTGTWLVLIGLVIGKPLGITLLTFIGEKVFRLQIPESMNYRHIVTLGCVVGIGFTVALFVATAAFPSNDPSLNPVKMGALMSFGSALVSFAVARTLGVKRFRAA